MTMRSDRLATFGPQTNHVTLTAPTLRCRRRVRKVLLYPSDAVFPYLPAAYNPSYHDSGAAHVAGGGT